MTIDKGRIDARKVSITLVGWPRIIQSRFSATPLGAGYGSSRFSSPTNAFSVLYAAANFQTAFAEAVVRDRFQNRKRWYLYRPILEARMATEVRSIATLELLDLTGGGAYELGVDTDTSRARAHTSGQKFSEDLHNVTTLDGILYDSRLSNGHCVAIYNRAFGKLAASNPIDLLRLTALEAELKRLKIIVRRKYGTGAGRRKKTA